MFVHSAKWIIITEFKILNVAPPSNLAIRKVFPDWLSSCTCQRGRREKILEEEGNKQANKQQKGISSGLVKKIYIIIIIIIIIVIVKRYICKVYILYRSSGIRNCLIVANCMYIENKVLPAVLQKVLKRLAMTWRPLL